MVEMNIRIVLVLLALGAALFGQQSGALTARQVIERIQAHVGVPWRSETVDTFKAGDPETRVTGIATTMMATYDVLVRAAAAGKNLIITHEPTFYSHLDRTEGFEKEHDAVWAEKERFIKEHNLVVWRFHDHWHMMKPDGIMFGVVRALGWQKFQSASEPSLFVVPEMTVAQLAEQMKARLGIHVLRYVANPEMKVARVGLAPGASGPERHLKLLRRDDVEVLAIGEVPEWETIEYVTDAVSEGKKKALILLGHIPSEQPGMEYCAEWLKTFVSEVPVEFIATKEPFLLAK
jgi:putative NIF3 family GTP cyclohydrolase 1 type 2